MEKDSRRKNKKIFSIVFVRRNERVLGVCAILVDIDREKREYLYIYVVPLPTVWLLYRFRLSFFLPNPHWLALGVLVSFHLSRTLWRVSRDIFYRGWSGGYCVKGKKKKWRNSHRYYIYISIYIYDNILSLKIIFFSLKYHRYLR